MNVTFASNYGCLPDITLRVSPRKDGTWYLSAGQNKRIRRIIGDSGDYYPGLVLPHRGEGCWQYPTRSYLPTDVPIV